MKQILKITVFAAMLIPHHVSALDVDLCKSECFKTCCSRTTSQCSSSVTGGTSDSQMCNNAVCTTVKVTQNPQSYCPLVVKEYEVVDVGYMGVGSAPVINGLGEVAFDNLKMTQPATFTELVPDQQFGFRRIGALSDTGEFVGSSYSGFAGPSGCNATVHATPREAFIDWTTGATAAHSIGESGMIGGTCTDGGSCYAYPRNHFACLYTRNESILVELEPGLQTNSINYYNVGVFAINNNDEAVGASVRKINNVILVKAFFRDFEGELTEISPSQNAESEALDLNAGRIVVGRAKFDEENFQAFVYSVDSETLVNLATKLGNPTSSVANAINDDGLVVGTAIFEDDDTTESKAFVFDSSQEDADVKFLEDSDGSVFQTADDINNAGEIVGTTNDASNVYMLRPLKLRESERVNLDFDFDGLGDFSVWRPSLGGWFASQVSSRYLQWGLSQDIPLLGNFDSDVNREAVVYRPQNGTWYVNKGKSPLTSGSTVVAQHGLPGDIPLLGDTNGDNRDDFVVWRQFLQTGPITIEGQWYIKPSAGSGAKEIQWGLRGDLPYMADFDGDGLADIGVWRNATGEWYVLKSSENYSKASAKFIHKQWGLPGDHPMPGDYDGDGRADLAVWRPSNGTWYICPSRFEFECSKATAVQWGLPGDIPVSVAMNGNHTLSLAVYRPYPKAPYGEIEGTWYLRDLLLSEVTIKQWGLRNDVPMKQSIRTTMKQMGLL